MKKLLLPIIILFIISCKSKTEKVSPEIKSITESVYASGLVKSKNQYQVYATISGIIKDIPLSEGDTVQQGDLLFAIEDENQKLLKENAALNAAYASLQSNSEKIKEAKALLEVAQSKMANDSAFYFRQKNLWAQQVGSKADLELKALNYELSKANYLSAKVKYDDLQKTLKLNAEVAGRNLAINSKLESDFSIRSQINGIIYSINKKKGETVYPQTPLAIVGDAGHFLLEMQVDEYDILRVKKGQQVMITLDSYKGKVFEGVITKINPLMNERSKTFLVEAEFINAPPKLFPNVSIEANIILQSKKNALLIPRKCLLNDSLVIKENKDTVRVGIGLKDYQYVEILSGIEKNDVILVPKE
ncbi:MAG: efflux RND transporter periplasmic adaptor subunit [Bacteroidia bacterium]|nr:efflux RND transporter periplasmic adaptor subunit [Bacteroidia bacterium]